jgi:hypothetical protein
MKAEKKKKDVADDIKTFEIKLERIPVENLAEVTETLDRVRTAAQKLVGKIAEAADKYAEASDELIGRSIGVQTHSAVARRHLEIVSVEVGKALEMLDRGMKIVLSAAITKEKLNSGKR